MLIDDYLPRFDASERHGIPVRASAQGGCTPPCAAGKWIIEPEPGAKPGYKERLLRYSTCHEAPLPRAPLCRSVGVTAHEENGGKRGCAAILSRDGAGEYLLGRTAPQRPECKEST